EDAARARRFGAQGIGLCRTEHMFLGERRELVERLILAEGPDEVQAVLDELLPLQRGDFVKIFEAMDGLPVTVRLLDPPLHEFLPSLTDLSVKVALNEAKGVVNEHDDVLLAAVLRLHEQNPMLGLRGVRLGLVIKHLFQMQTQAIMEAAAIVATNGAAVTAEIMVPLVGSVNELALIRQEIDLAVHEARVARSVHFDHKVGTMIELPRAAVTAREIATVADFFSFGTNDLTQMVWGFSRDDVESSFFSEYLEKGIFPVSPFETIDRDGVGRLVRIAAWEGRETKPDLKLGICGEHGGDPESIHFFHESGLDYVSCSPFRVPVARLEAGRAAIGS
ncbi:MAG TPA: pyruvate, phosphate dikinase, partial [Phycicoccus sp.]|nr:pyruvate, phosphate dikinase [Phycicoccus sp.]